MLADPNYGIGNGIQAMSSAMNKDPQMSSKVAVTTVASRHLQSPREHDRMNIEEGAMNKTGTLWNMNLNN